MVQLESLHLEHLPPGYDIHIGFYQDVKNASFLHQQLLAGNTDFEYALVDASVIISRLHILSSAYRAINDFMEQRLRSRNVHSEIVLSLSPTNNIAEAFRRYGISPSTTSLLVVKLSTPEKPFTAEAVQAHLEGSVEGTAVPFEDAEISKSTDLTRIKKIYRLNSGGTGGKKALVKGHGSALGIDEKKETELQVLSAMALRGAS